MGDAKGILTKRNKKSKVLRDFEQVSNDAEAELIAEHNRNINILDNKLQEETEKILDSIRNSAKKFINIEAMVFDEELNSKFYKSIERANFVGVPQEKILKTLDDINYKEKLKHTILKDAPFFVQY